MILLLGRTGRRARLGSENLSGTATTAGVCESAIWESRKLGIWKYRNLESKK